MRERRGISIRYKLGLLACVPVMGALLLSGTAVRDARRQTEAASVLGSSEDLALFTSQITGSLHHLQGERALLGLRFGEPADSQLKAAFDSSDKAVSELQGFLKKRDMKRLPPRLAHDIGAAESQLGQLNDQRVKATTAGGGLGESLDFYAQTDSALIDVIADLMLLSEQGDLIRAISSHVSVLQFKESVSQEHALLANVFQHKELTPELYKVLVTQVTEQRLLERLFRQHAPDETQNLFDRALRGDVATWTASMRQKVLDTEEEALEIEASEWMRMQGRRVESLRALENLLAQRVRKLAVQKSQSTRADMTTSLAVGAVAFIASLLLGLLIARSVRPTAAGSVRPPERARKELA